MSRMDLGTRIAAWRHSRGLTQQEVAEGVGVVVSAVSMWEGGSNPPSNKNLEKLIAFYGITTLRFYGRVPKASVPKARKLRGFA